MFSGDLIDHARALRIGLVDEVVPAGDLAARVEGFVATLLERSHLTQVATKAMVHEVITDGRVKPATTMKWESAMDQSGEVREGVAAFLAKRAVRWPWRRG
jgi:enoyl-CoA hydratase/carnithine racemase